MADLGALAWLQDWYASQCDGEWEHGYGVKIGTLDNPGWSVEINLVETEWAAKTVDPLKIEESADHWIHAWIANGKFKGFGDPHRLEEIILTFRRWIEA